MSEDVSQSPSPEGKPEPRKYKNFKPAPPNYVGADPNMQLPPKGVPVYVDHPFIARDKLFNDMLCAAVVARWAMVNAGVDKSETDEVLSWLQGEIPIPENILEMLITLRAKHVKMDGLDVESARPPDLAESA